MHGCARDALAGVPPQRVIDDESNDPFWREALDEQGRQSQADRVGRPASSREEAMIAADVFESDCARRPDAQPAIRVTKLAIEGEVKQPENACSCWTKEATIGVSDTFRFLF